ncbi:MAG TPA: RluA family pseudouridine synthase [Terriglobales bacterium]|nr:RluA family pseudouridine synthase [Terriglobales bacterium]
MAAKTAFTCQQAAPRLDRFLHACLPDMSRTRLQGLIQAGGVRVNGAPSLRPSTAVAAGDRVELTLAPPPPSTLTPEDIPLDVLYEDDDLVVVNKPAGLVVHPAAGTRSGTLVHALLHRYGTLSETGGAARPGIVHRLDKGTSGVMVVARNDFAHQRLAQQFQARQVEKYYLALVQGTMAAPTGEAAQAIRRDRRHRLRMTTRGGGEDVGREALTRYQVLEAFRPPAGTPAGLRAACSYSWLRVRIHTGRTHQIRVHMAALGHPVVGDRLYGAAAALAGPGALAGLRPERVMLHATELAFTHPRTGAALRFTAPPPPEMQTLLAELRAACQPSGL